MMNDKKDIRQVAGSPKTTQVKAKTRFRDVEFLTEVLACIAWTTKG